MAVAVFQRRNFTSASRSTAGQKVAYIARAGAYGPALAHVQHLTQDGKAEHIRDDLVYTNHRNMPAWAQDDPARFFTEARKHERANGVAYTEWKFSLPRELSHVQNMDVARDVLQMTFDTTHPYVWAFHDPVAADGERQPHAHVIFSARTVDGLDRSPEQFFRRWNAAHPERGGAHKDPAMNCMGAVKAARVLYTDVVNVHLEQHGHAARLDPRSLGERGIDRTPEPKLLPSDSNQLKHHFVVTERMQNVFAHRFARTQSAPAELADAQAYWQRRKIELGISRAMPIHEQLAHIREAREQAIIQAPARVPAHELAHQAQALEHSIGGLEKYAQRLQQEYAIEMRYREDFQRPYSGQRSAERLLAQGTDHGLPRDLGAEKAVAELERRRGPVEREQAPTVGYRARIFGRERQPEQEHDQGMDIGF